MRRVSCICPTYGRPPDHTHLIEEAVESFVRQDYPNKELILLNDAKEQELICNAPNVRVINHYPRYGSLGEKYNAGISFSSGELICPWEDDDISLPWRISLSVRMLGNYDYWNPKRYWFLNGDGLHSKHSMGYAHNSSIYTREIWQRVGGYPGVSGSQDAAMDGLLSQYFPAPTSELPIEEWFYVYRWGVSPDHLSARPPYEEFWQEVGRRALTEGKFTISPKWVNDYLAMRTEHLINLRNNDD